MNKIKLLTLFLFFISFFYSFAGSAKTPSDVYDFQLKNIIPMVAKLANIKKIKVPFKIERNSNLKPVDVYIILSMNYIKLQKKFDLREITFKSINNVLPDDVYDLSEEVVSRLSQKVKKFSLSEELHNEYKKWKSRYRTGGASIVPGDVFYLNVYLNYLIKDL